MPIEELYEWAAIRLAKNMTIKEIYEWALTNHCENFDLYQVDVDAFEIDEEDEAVIIP